MFNKFQTLLNELIF